MFSSEPGFALTGQDAGLDVDRFDEHCDHLLVREENSGELVGCYRMLPPQVPLRPEDFTPQRNSTSQRWTRCGRPWWRWDARWCINDHRNGAVVLLMWAGILAYLDRCDYDYVTGCVSVPVSASEAYRRAARSAVFATSCCGVTPRRPITGYIRIGR